MTQCSAPVGVFDSGFGGLSVMHSIRRELPLEDLLYAADCANAPYGDRSEAFITERTVAVGRWLESIGCKAIAVACNTATTVAIAALRSSVSIPVIGIEPAVKPAARMTRSGTAAIMATTRTLASRRYQELVRAHSAGVRIIPQPCPGLVEYVEKGAINSDEVRALVKGYVRPLVAQGADTIALSCTHYPFLADLIRAEAPGVTIFEPGPAVARQVQRRLSEAGTLAGAGPAGTELFYASGASAQREAVCSRLWGRRVKLLEMPA